MPNIAPKNAQKMSLKWPKYIKKKWPEYIPKKKTAQIFPRNGPNMKMENGPNLFQIGPNISPKYPKYVPQNMSPNTNRTVTRSFSQYCSQ